MTISRTFHFEASHILPRHPGKCSRLHGHSYELTVSVKGAIDSSTGFVCDYGELKTLVLTEIIDKVDHQHLGQGGAFLSSTTSSSSPSEEKEWVRMATASQFPPNILGANFYPSAENLVARFAEILWKALSYQKRQEGVPEISLYRLVLKETMNTEAIWEAKG